MCCSGFTTTSPSPFASDFWRRSAGRIWIGGAGSPGDGISSVVSRKFVFQKMIPVPHFHYFLGVSLAGDFVFRKDQAV